MSGPLARLFGREVPPGVAGQLAPEEHALRSAGGLLATSLGLWVPEGDGYRRIGWHMISKAVWRDGVLTVTESRETGVLSGIVLLEDLAPRRFTLERAGKLPRVVHQRVTDSVRSSHRRALPGGGAWVVQRKTPGRGVVMLQLRADRGTDPEAVRALAGQVAEGVRQATEQ